jgi:hypothetical protein
LCVACMLQDSLLKNKSKIFPPLLDYPPPSPLPASLARSRHDLLLLVEMMSPHGPCCCWFLVMCVCACVNG